MQTTFDNKIKAISLGIILSVIIIILRLFYLQIYLNEKLFSLGQKNFTRMQKVICPRGNIVDANNHLLVTNRPVINIYWQGTGKRNLSPEQISMIQFLEKIIEINLTNPEKLNEIKIAERYSKTTPIATDLAFDKLSKIAEQFSDSNNIAISTDFKRFYPHESMASHVIGYLTQIDLDAIGKMGLEKLFEDELKGQSGCNMQTINSLGKSLNSQQIKPPVPGRTIKTTLDLHLQKIAEAVFPAGFKGGLIIMDPEDGAIKAILSRPNFDPTTFLNQLSNAQWKELQDKQPFLNRIFNACYPPASIFKLVSVSAALEMGIVKQECNWYCNGFINFVNRRYRCGSKIHGHGSITPKEAIVKSCNTFFYNIAKHLYIDDLANYANRFGLGQKTGIMFAEKTGLIPTNSWKLKVYGEAWWPGETLSAVIGQSYLLVTPLQIARMISGIFQGYLVTPRILEEEKVEKKPLNIQRDTLEFLKDSMRTVITAGTGQRVGRLKDFTIYAKTGTAQTSALEKREISEEHFEHAWFASNFAYKNNKPLTMIFLVEHASSTAGVITAAREFFIQYKQLLSES